MRSWPAPLARLAFVASVLGLTPALAAEPGSVDTSRLTDTEAARAHFKTGVRLYQDKDYGGALAEFEAAYSLKPGPGSLQNVALCQKALFRYGEAADSLGRLLTRHAAELSDAERSAAESAKTELETLVGAVRLEISPPHAAVTLDDRPFTPPAAAGSVRVNVGEHTFAASAPGYARATRALTVASGQSETTVSLVLEPSAGFVNVSAPNPKDAIAIDGTPVAYGRFQGPVTPDVEHLVQVYEGQKVLFETRVHVELGKTLVIGNAAPNAGSAAETATGPAPAATAKSELGWYGMGSFSLLATSTPPFRFELSEASSSAFGIGLRAGRRVRPVLAVEGLLEYSALHADHACDRRRGELTVPPISCGTPEAAALDVGYSVRSVRFGPTLELMTPGPRLRGFGGLGFGFVWHELHCDGCSQGTEQKSSGTDAYFLMELGIGANTRHVLMALALQTFIDGTARMISGRDLSSEAGTTHETAYERSGRALPYVGLELRLGVSEWAP